MNIWNYLLIVSLVMNFWCVAKIDKLQKLVDAISKLTDMHQGILEKMHKMHGDYINTLKESTEWTYKMFSDLIKIVKGDTQHDSDRQG